MSVQQVCHCVTTKIFARFTATASVPAVSVQNWHSSMLLLLDILLVMYLITEIKACVRGISKHRYLKYALTLSVAPFSLL